MNNHSPTMETGIDKAIRLAGNQTALGKLLGLTPQAIQKWAAQGVAPGERCREIEARLDGQVTRYELNPAVFGEPPAVVTEASQPQ
jgi:DNA-binding transcriptional regulator YdaS (Cro superfamily)